jgi:coenzyme F420-reducing hydrogenase alpha subunit
MDLGGDYNFRKSKKIIIPHIHKIEGEAGFWAKVTNTGKIEELKFQTLLGLRQIEGILIGRRYFEVPIIVSRICGICPVPHILGALTAIEKALNIKVSEETVFLRKLLLAANIIHSHTLHLFFLSLPDFFNIENDLDLLKKFKKESKAALRVRNLALEIVKVVGGRAVHPITPIVGGFTKIPEKEKLKKFLEKIPQAIEDANLLIETFKKIEYPEFKRETLFASVFNGKDYPYYFEKIVKIGNEKFTFSDFYSVQIEEDLKSFPVKRVKFKGKAYMLGAIARIKNNGNFLTKNSKEKFEEFLKERKISNEEYFKNIFYNIFSQAIEILHFLEVCQELLKEILKFPLKEEKLKINFYPTSGLSALEAPRGTLFHYYEIDKEGRILNCNIITPTAQFLHNIEEDLKFFLPKILKLKKKEQIRKIRALIRVYDPCISCATH